MPLDFFYSCTLIDTVEIIDPHFAATLDHAEPKRLKDTLQHFPQVAYLTVLIDKVLAPYTQIRQVHTPCAIWRAGTDPVLTQFLGYLGAAEGIRNDSPKCLHPAEVIFQAFEDAEVAESQPNLIVLIACVRFLIELRVERPHPI